MSRAKAFSLLTEETVDLGVPTENLETLLGLAETVATGHDDIVVYIEGPALQKWEST